MKTKTELIKERQKIYNALEEIDKKNNYYIADARTEQHKRMLLQYLKEINKIIQNKKQI